MTAQRPRLITLTQIRIKSVPAYQEMADHTVENHLAPSGPPTTRMIVTQAQAQSLWPAYRSCRRKPDKATLD